MAAMHNERHNELHGDCWSYSGHVCRHISRFRQVPHLERCCHEPQRTSERCEQPSRSSGWQCDAGPDCTTDTYTCTYFHGQGNNYDIDDRWASSSQARQRSDLCRHAEPFDRNWRGESDLPPRGQADPGSELEACEWCCLLLICYAGKLGQGQGAAHRTIRTDESQGEQLCQNDPSHEGSLARIACRQCAELC